MFVGYVAFNMRDRRASARPLFFLVFSTMLLLMTAYSKRFVEYFPPFAVLFAAFTLQTLFAKRESEIATLPADVLDELQPFLDREAERIDEHTATTDERWRDDEVTVFGATVALLAAAATNLALPTSIEFGISALVLAAGFIGYYFFRGHRLLPAFVVAVAIGFALFFSVRQAAADIAERDANSIFRASPERFRGAMDWVKANVPKGELIFNTNWDHFPKLFFESSDHAYVSGLDPNYLLDANRELSGVYDDIRSGREENAAELIRERFKARYIFTDQKKRGEDFFFQIMRSGWVEEVYDDEFATILLIRDARGEVPSEYIDGDDPPDENQPENEDTDEPAGDPDADAATAGDATSDSAPSSDEQR
jgi:Skp family chaperone for outer membrane proteins